MEFWEVLLAGGALMLIFEGIVPFVSPNAWKNTMCQALALSNGQLRFLGLLAILVGLFLLLSLN